MSGFRDLHCHLLFGLDDGAKSPDETVEMARLLVDLGYSHCAPSPHARSEYAPRAEAVLRLEQATALLGEAGVPLTLLPNAEHSFLEPDFLPSVDRADLRCIGGGRYVLVEAPYSSPVPSLPDLIFRMKLKGFIPLIAHPERCLEFERKESARNAIRSGAFLQLDLGSLIGRYGRTAQKLAEAFLQSGLYSVAATDLHSPVRARDWLERALKALGASVGEAGARTLLAAHPEAILQGDALPEPG